MKPLGEGWRRLGGSVPVSLPGEFEARRLDSGMQLIKNTCNVKGLRHFDPQPTAYAPPLSRSFLSLLQSLSGCCRRHFVAYTEEERESK